jgi:hypothetical protein
MSIPSLVVDETVANPSPTEIIVASPLMATLPDWPKFVDESVTDDDENPADGLGEICAQPLNPEQSNTYTVFAPVAETTNVNALAAIPLPNKLPAVSAVGTIL